MNTNQAKLLLIISIFIIPFFISFLMLDDYAEDKKWDTTNYGILIKPVLPINNVMIKTSSNISNTTEFNGKWSLMYYLKNDCSSLCEENIHMLRQINSALGKDMNRLQRILIHDQNIKHPINLKKLYPSMIYIYNKPNNLHGILSAISENQPSIFLIDPLGNVILKYSEDFQGKKLLKDIKKLLKLSRIG